MYHHGEKKALYDILAKLSSYGGDHGHGHYHHAMVNKDSPYFKEILQEDKLRLERELKELAEDKERIEKEIEEITKLLNQ